MTLAQVGPYTHFVGGAFSRQGYMGAKGFAAFNNIADNFKNFPNVDFGGNGIISDIAPAGNGFLVVGDFTSVNSMEAYGVAYYDGKSWCSMPHLNLYTVNKVVPPETRFPRTIASSPGSAAAIYVSGTNYYIFGGSVSSSPRFNQVGTTRVGVAGLVIFKFDGTSNFTVDASLNYLTQGRFSDGTLEFNGNGFPALSAPNTNLGKTKIRMFSLNGVTSFYVHPNVGTQTHLYRWRITDGSWLTVTQRNICQTFYNFNVTGSPTTFSVTADNINGCYDFDVDPTSGTVFIVGGFDNTNNINLNVRYLNVAKSTDSQTTVITWQSAVNWANYNNFNQSGQIARTIVVANQNQFYVSTSFSSQDVNDNLFGVRQFYIYSVASGSPTNLGGRFATFNGSEPTFSRLSLVSNFLHVFGDFGLYNYVFDQNNVWPRRYTRKVPNCVYWDGNDWQDGYGGYTTLTTGYIPLLASTTEVDYLYVASATAFYHKYTSGLVSFNKDQKNWDNRIKQRFTTPGTVGNDGFVNTVHFIKKQRSGVSDAVLVGGLFDWYGTQYLASAAYYRTSTNVFEQLGGGVFNAEANRAYTGDQTTPIYKAGTINDFEESGDLFYAGGFFSKNINGKCLSNIASVSVNNGIFESLDSGCNGEVFDLLVDGNNLYVGGSFTSCSGVPGTRRIAAWNINDKKFVPLSTGFSDGNVQSMIMYRGSLYVGGSFISAPASYRSSGPTGLYRWDGNAWSPVVGKCSSDCDSKGLTSPFSASDPLTRSTSNVKSMLVNAGNLYILGQVQTSANSLLIQYDGSQFRQLGAAISSSCSFQGCISSNVSSNTIIAAGFSRGDSYNNNYQSYKPDYQNWVETNNGFDASPIFVASSSMITISLLLSFISYIFIF